MNKLTSREVAIKLVTGDPYGWGFTTLARWHRRMPPHAYTLNFVN